jgi:hypothetical protein
VGQVVRTRKSGDQFSDFVASWRVTADGTFCHTQPEGGTETCRNNVRLNGNVIEMDGVGGASGVKYVLLKGNPKDLKIGGQ